MRPSCFAGMLWTWPPTPAPSATSSPATRAMCFPTPPRRRSSYLLFQDRVFQELKNLEDIQKRRTVEDLVKVANARGLSVNDLLFELDSGRGVDGIFRLLKSRER